MAREPPAGRWFPNSPTEGNARSHFTQRKSEGGRECTARFPPHPPALCSPSSHLLGIRAHSPHQTLHKPSSHFLTAHFLPCYLHGEGRIQPFSPLAPVRLRFSYTAMPRVPAALTDTPIITKKEAALALSPCFSLHLSSDLLAFWLCRVPPPPPPL